MNCPNCQNIIPDDSAFCTMCGAPIPQAPQQAAPSYQQQAYNPAGYQQQPYGAPTGGQPFDPFGAQQFGPAYEQQYSGAFRPEEPKKADPKARLWVLLVTALCVVALIGSCIITQVTSIENIPMFSMLDAMGMDEAKEEIGNAYDMAKDAYEDREDDFTSREKRAVEDFLDATKALSESFSISNMKSLVKSAEGIGNLDLSGANDITDEVDDLMAILNGLSGFMWGFMLFCLAFTLCGGLFNIKGLAITGLIFSILYGLLLCGIAFVIIFVAVHAALIVMISKYKNATA